jgi:hypothetical protein
MLGCKLGCHYFSDLLRHLLAFAKVRSSRGRKKSKAGGDMDEKNDAPLSYIWKIRERVYSLCPLAVYDGFGRFVEEATIGCHKRGDNGLP